MFLWRLCELADAARAFDGEGARLYGGRWNHKGTRLVYASSSLSLAALECLAHAEAMFLKRQFFRFRVEVEEAMIEVLAPAQLPASWRRYPAPEETRALGSRWAVRGRKAILSVPSVIVPEERNYLLNPLHADFEKLTFGKANPFSFDPRLRKSER
jgi:RES domain-containing protein